MESRQLLAALFNHRLGWLLLPVQLEVCKSPWHFIFCITVQNLVASLIVAVPLYLLAPEGHHPAADPDFPLTHDLWGAALAMALIAPFFETLLLQATPIEFARAIRQPRWVQFLLGVIPFAALHFPMGIKVGIAAGIVAGLFLSHAYLEGRNRSILSAIWITMVIHGIHNLICIAGLFLAVWSSPQ